MAGVSLSLSKAAISNCFLRHPTIQNTTYGKTSKSPETKNIYVTGELTCFTFCFKEG